MKWDLLREQLERYLVYNRQQLNRLLNTPLPNPDAISAYSYKIADTNDMLDHVNQERE